MILRIQTGCRCGLSPFLHCTISIFDQEQLNRWKIYLGSELASVWKNQHKSNLSWWRQICQRWQMMSWYSNQSRQIKQLKSFIFSLFEMESSSLIWLTCLATHSSLWSIRNWSNYSNIYYSFVSYRQKYRRCMLFYDTRMGHLYLIKQIKNDKGYLWVLHWESVSMNLCKNLLTWERDYSNVCSLNVVELNPVKCEVEISGDTTPD